MAYFHRDDNVRKSCLTECCAELIGLGQDEWPGANCCSVSIDAAEGLHKYSVARAELDVAPDRQNCSATRNEYPKHLSRRGLSIRKELETLLTEHYID